MRRPAALLVLFLTATDAQAAMDVSAGGTLLGYFVGCCFVVPFSVVLAMIIAMAIYDWRKVRRDRPPTGPSGG